MLHGEREELVNEVTELALRYGLVSAYTSFVAVDNQVVNPEGKTVLVAARSDARRRELRGSFRQEG